MKLRKFAGFVLVWAGLQWAPPAAAQQVLTLQQCVDTALTRNLRVQQAGLREQSATISSEQARLNQLPTANGGIFHGMNQGRSIDPFTNGYVNQQISYSTYALGADLLLYNGGSLQHARRGAGYALDAARMETEQERTSLTLLVVLAYLQVLNNEDLLAQAQANASVTEKQVARLQVLNQQGAVAPPLVQELTGQLRNEQARIAEARNALELSRIGLAQLMNKGYDPAMQLERLPANALPQQTLADYRTMGGAAENQWPLVQAMRLRQQSARQIVLAEKGRLYPSLFLSSNANTTYSSAARREVLLNTTEKATSNYVLLNGSKLPVFVQQGQYDSKPIAYSSQLRNNIYANVELGLRLPLFNGLQVRNRIRQARVEVQNWAVQEEATRIQLRNDIDQAAVQLQTARTRTQALQEGVTAFAEAFRAAEVRFNAGVGTVVDYLIAKNNLDQARANLVRTQYDYLLRQKVLDFYLYRKLQ